MAHKQSRRGRPSVPIKEKKCHLVVTLLNYRQWKRFARAVKRARGYSTDVAREMVIAGTEAILR